MGETRIHDSHEAAKTTLEYYLVHDEVPAEVRDETVALYDDGEYLAALELLLNRW